MAKKFEEHFIATEQDDVIRATFDYWESRTREFDGFPVCMIMSGPKGYSILSGALIDDTAVIHAIDSAAKNIPR